MLNINNCLDTEYVAEARRQVCVRDGEELKQRLVVNIKVISDINCESIR